MSEGTHLVADWAARLEHGHGASVVSVLLLQVCVQLGLVSERPELPLAVHSADEACPVPLHTGARVVLTLFATFENLQAKLKKENTNNGRNEFISSSIFRLTLHHVGGFLGCLVVWCLM